MKKSRREIENTVSAFLKVADLAGDPISRAEIEMEYLPAPYRAPARLPPGRMAVYGFWGNGSWLKVGMAGPKSTSRNTSQYHNAGSARSTLAGSLVKDRRMRSVARFDRKFAGVWIKVSTSRVNILLPATQQRELLSLLAVFLHPRLKPRYEG